MKKPKYRLRIEAKSVIVEHRVSLGASTLLIFVLGYLSCYCIVPDFRKAVMQFCTSASFSTGAALLWPLPILGLSGWSWLRFASGEVLCCDRSELRFAQRRTWGRWHRFRFASRDVKKLQRAIRGSSKSRNYSVLTFDVQGRSYDMLEDMGYTDSDRVLRVCRSMGYEVIIDETADAMMKDIEKRGWWINPFRTDDLGGSSDSSVK